jgi:hypothetical protein
MKRILEENLRKRCQVHTPEDRLGRERTNGSSISTYGFLTKPAKKHTDPEQGMQGYLLDAGEELAWRLSLDCSPWRGQPCERALAWRLFRWIVCSDASGAPLGYLSVWGHADGGWCWGSRRVGLEMWWWEIESREEKGIRVELRGLELNRKEVFGNGESFFILICDSVIKVGRLLWLTVIDVSMWFSYFHINYGGWFPVFFGGKIGIQIMYLQSGFTNSKPIIII